MEKFQIFSKLLVLFLFVTTCFSEEIKIGWTAPTQDQIEIDHCNIIPGSIPYTSLTYRVFIGEQPRKYTQSFNAGTNTVFTFTNLSASITYYFAVSSVDSNLNESPFSCELVLIEKMPPDSPKSVQIKN